MCSTIVRNFYLLLYAPTFSFVSAWQMSIWVWMFSKTYIWSSVSPLQHVLSTVEPLWQSIISLNEVAALCCTLLHLCLSVWSARLPPDHSWHCALGCGQRLGPGCRQGPSLYQALYLFWGMWGLAWPTPPQWGGETSVSERETPHDYTPLRHLAFIFFFFHSKPLEVWNTYTCLW